MEVAIVTVKYSRETGKEISREIKEIIEVDEDEYYRPLVEELAKAFLRDREKERSRQ